MAVRRRKNSKFTTRMKKKLFVITALIMVALFALSIRMIWINRKNGEKYKKAVFDNFNYDSRTVVAKRGEITDRNGTVLACSSRVYNLILDAKVLLSDEKYKEPTMKAILDNFDVDETQLTQFIEENERYKQEGKTISSYKRLLTTLSVEQVQPVKNLMEEKDSMIKGIWFEEEYQRVYPYKALACDVIGFASDNNGGEIGLENYYDDELSGTNGRTFGYIDNDSYEKNRKNPINGNTVVSTLDFSIQNIVEDVIADFNKEYGSKSSSVIVMNPNNGEILAMADYPNFDLNNPRDLSHIYSEEDLAGFDEGQTVEKYFDIWKNYCVSSIYEPGSVFKAFTVAEALEQHTEELTDTFICDGYAVYNGAKITCHGGEGHGELTLAKALGLSCNEALMQISEKMGVNLFTDYFEIFKLGMKTGIDLPSEESGLVREKEEMMPVDLATNSFGQNLNVTMTQMVSIFSSIVNGGYYYKPHLVKQIKSENGEVVKDIQPELVAQTISEDTSKVMRSILRTVVDYGTGGYVHLNNYSIGGKTGTAEKAGRKDDEYVVSFLGFAPAENPEVLVYVVVDAPQCEEYNSSWCAQIMCKKIFQKLLPYMGIKPLDPEYEMDIPVNAENLEEYAEKRGYNPNGDIPELVPKDTNIGDVYKYNYIKDNESETTENETPPEGGNNGETAPPSNETPPEGGNNEETAPPSNETPPEGGDNEGAAAPSNETPPEDGNNEDAAPPANETPQENEAAPGT